MPKRLLDPMDLGSFLSEVDWVKVWTSGGNLIVDIWRDEVEPDDEAWDDGSGWLAALSPLRADLLSGDLRLFYLLWLTAIEEDFLPDDTAEPLPGLGPLTGALEAAVDFFGIDRDLVEAAAACSCEEELAPDALRASIAGLGETEKTDLLLRLMEGDAHIVPELRWRARTQSGDGMRARRTAGELRATARKIREERKRAEAERRRAEERRKAEEAEKARRARLDAVRCRGENVWTEIETEIERRNASGYDRAAALLADLKTLAAEPGAVTDFSRRLTAIRARHARKGQFIKRLQGL